MCQRNSFASIGFLHYYISQLRSGGVHLDAIFVDEGFGTLSPDDLDLVMESFQQLHSGGRLVDIISHVPELKERIPARLQVNKSNRGSTAHFVLP